MATTDAVVAKPLIYNGSLTTYASWRRSISLYMTVNQTKFPDDNTKIACALSYMTEGTASTWAQAFFEEKNATGTFVPGTWADFTTRLDATFKDINLQKKATKALLEKEISIDKEGPERFFAEYEILARDAGLITGVAANDIVHVHNLTRLMPFDLRDRLNAADPPPADYVRFKRLVGRYYPAYKEKADRQRLFRNRQSVQKPTGRVSEQAEARRGPNPSQNQPRTQGNAPKPKGFVSPKERER